MIRVLADSAHDAALIEEAVGGAAQVVNGAAPLTGGDAHVECVVVGCRSPVAPGRLELVRKIAQEVPWAPIIFVTDPTLDSAQWFREGGVSEIVWFNDVHANLRSRIESQCRTVVLSRWAAEVESSTLPPALCSALAYGIRAATDRPVRRVQALADALGRSPVTLSQAFRTAVTGEATLSQFLSALVILRAHQLRTSGLSWEAVSRHLEFRRPTLHSKSKKWPGRTLKQLAQTPRQHLLAKFTADHLEPLLDGDAPARRDAPQRPASTVEPISPDPRSSMS
ncbi:MAG: hypothetical protein OXH46_11655 [Gemmatimonadetes bacterium]|nr:hypothetical protein [Gemmatimonadota bacterium]